MHTAKFSNDMPVVLPAGFHAAGVSAGIKKDGKEDMALVFSDQDAVMAGTFTSNQVRAAPVKWCLQRLPEHCARAIVINSGNANACNGAVGLRDAARMAALAADGLRLSDKLVYVCSTGTIGKPLPMDKIEQGIADLVAAAHEQGGLQAARAMMTTDTREKYIVKEIELDGRQVRITGLAKGAGMIEPHMGTMLAFLLTDAAVEAQTLQDILRKAVSQSFNRVSVDGDQSTNDTVLFMANGRAGNTPLCADHPDTAVFADAVEQVTLDLAMKIASDGEGATRLVMVQVTGAEDDTQADQAARAVANSMLNKTAWAGGSANWGRIMDALGYSPARVKEERVDISYDDIPAVEGGISANPDSAELNAVMQKDCLTISIDLHLGHGRAIVYTCDCTEEYVRINM